MTKLMMSLHINFNLSIFLVIASREIRIHNIIQTHKTHHLSKYHLARFKHSLLDMYQTVSCMLHTNMYLLYNFVTYGNTPNSIVYENSYETIK